MDGIASGLLSSRCEDIDGPLRMLQGQSWIFFTVFVQLRFFYAAFNASLIHGFHCPLIGIETTLAPVQPREESQCSLVAIRPRRFEDGEGFAGSSGGTEFEGKMPDIHPLVSPSTLGFGDDPVYPQEEPGERPYVENVMSGDFFHGREGFFGGIRA